ncbi:WD40-like Beta Propeller Repeat [Flexibacter flexilis DSM 6793]|uniref:WD40-like Beta Propeller Repeat n=1 Tax=Flexibacter flexilis DSM 6793 TaxID=927664 RepID=A0A1I1DMF7_9BACT|nr:OmpA family protein [Flexibacter flexilis]SFB75626.1 WD40-like Beta Propeller Repeat [Flexibacter flexilis DSM 6793]
MLKKIIYSFLFSALATQLPSFAQERDINKLSDPKKLQTAEMMLNLGSFYNAIEPLTDLVTRNPNQPIYASRLGEAYFFARDYENAEIWLTKAQKLFGHNDDLFAFMLGESLRYNGKYTEAVAQFTAFDNGKYRDRKGEMFHLAAKSAIVSCQKANQIKAKNQKAYVAFAGDNINHGYSDFAPRLRDDSTLVYSSYLSDTIMTSEYLEPNFNRVKLYSSAFNKETNEWGEPEEMKHLSRHLESTANGVFTPEGDEFYFTRCRTGKQGQQTCDIYMCKIKDGKFSTPIPLGKNINSSRSTQTQPYVVTTLNGKQKQKILYFASNRKGGRGGLDIWYALFNEKIGLYNRPINCGPEVNSVRDEVTPFYSVKENTLYFSSNSHPGIGGFDVFKSKGSLRTFSAPENLGTPLNTSYDDVYYTLAASEKAGYFVSNRKGSQGILPNTTCCDDIYAFDLEKPIEFGNKHPAPIVAKKDTAAVAQADTALPVVAKLTEPTKLAEPTPTPKKETVTVKEELVAEAKPTKKPKAKKKTTPTAKPKAKTTQPKATEQPQEESKPVYASVRTRVIVEFASDQDTAYLEYYPKLDSIANDLAKDSVAVKITGHADATGSLEYNQMLSEKRAKRMAEYLVAHGVNRELITTEGKGELKPIATNKTVKGRRHNRRTEFVYTKKVLKSAKKKKRK